MSLSFRKMVCNIEWKNPNSALEIFIIFHYSFYSLTISIWEFCPFRKPFSHILYANNIVVRNLQMKDIERVRWHG